MTVFVLNRRFEDTAILSEPLLECRVGVRRTGRGSDLGVEVRRGLLVGVEGTVGSLIAADDLTAGAMLVKASFSEISSATQPA